jgi:alkylhydroperoxidase family enzyme
MARIRSLKADEDAHLNAEFATTWPTYDVDPATRALLAYAKKLTESPALIEDGAIEALREAGWDEQGIYEATALVAFFNFSGRMEAASGLPMDDIPPEAHPPEVIPDGRGLEGHGRGVREEAGPAR